MPELPEVETVARELHKKLTGLRVVSARVLEPKSIGVGPKSLGQARLRDRAQAELFATDLSGRKIVSVRRRAKLLIFDLDNGGHVLVHLKMTGQLIFETLAQRKATGGHYRLLNKATAAKVKLPGPHTHVIIQFGRKGTLYFNDVRKFGFMKLLSPGEMDVATDMQVLGPEPLDKSFTLAKFTAQLARAGRRPIKPALMDPGLVAGIGNIYSDEILFRARIRPDRLVGHLSQADIRQIYSNIKPVLTQAIRAKGSSVGDFVRTDGRWGSMGKYHFVYGLSGHPCKKCGSRLQSMKLGGRTATFCPQCQK